MVADFQHGLLRLDVVLIAMALIAFGLGLTAIWMRLGVAVRRRVGESIALASIALAAIAGFSFASATWDLSESRENSFPRADEAALRSIAAPLRIEVHLAPEDPRRSDLEHRALSKLRRVMPRLQIEFVSSTTTGLFEQTAANYGELWYELDGRRAMSRVTTADGVLETVYDLARITRPAEESQDIFRGHPLASTPRGAATIFYGVWPAVVAVAAFVMRRRQA
jgi:hypothetical protein